MHVCYIYLLDLVDMFVGWCGVGLLEEERWKSGRKMNGNGETGLSQDFSKEEKTGWQAPACFYPISSSCYCHTGAYLKCLYIHKARK